MATISGATNEKVYSIPKWLGLNECPDGSTRLRMGEAGRMVNWRITKDGNLKRRDGTELVKGLRLAYELDESEEATEFGPFVGTDLLTWYASANVLSSPGAVVLNTAEQLSFAEAAAETEEWLASDRKYLEMDDHQWAVKKGSFTVDEETGAVMLNAYFVSAIPSTIPYDYPIAGMWSGYVAGKQTFLAACEGKLYSIYNSVTGAFQKDLIGAISTAKHVSFIPFDGKVYILNGVEYYEYNGTTLSTVTGYRPLIAISIGPLDTDTTGNGTNDTASNPGELTGEYINRLNGLRRVWISFDGENGTFQLPEKGTQESPLTLDWVYLAGTTTVPSNISWTFDGENGQIAFTKDGGGVPNKSVNSVEIAYTCPTTNRSQVTGNLYYELFSGTTDTRIFIYGDGTNRALYSGMDYDGMPRADYFPDQYEVHIGDSNTPITGMIRHYSSLVAYKPNECWALQHGIVELATNDLTPAIYSQPVNRDIGNVAPGQVRLVNNNPVTAFGQELYQWSNSSYYTSNLSRDERQARRISDRVQNSIKEFDLADAVIWDDNDHQEFYVCYGNNALVMNYANDTWYTYNWEQFSVACMCNFLGDLYIGTSDGRILRMSPYADSDEGWAIQAFWASGAMDFGADYLRKFASMLWVGLKPEEGTSVDVTLMTDRKDNFRIKVVSSEKAKIGGNPFTTRVKLKAKKFEFYYLGLAVREKMPAVTVTNVDFRVRTTGYAR